MRSLITYWHLDILMVAFLVSIFGAYYLLDGFVENKKFKLFMAGYVLIILSIASPLHFLGENYLMSAHMTSHVILILLAAPLLVLGIPDNGNKSMARFSAWLSKHPWLPWMAGVCVMWFWHIPVVFNRLFLPDAPVLGAGSIPVLSDLHLISLILTGVLFSWPVVGAGKTATTAYRPCSSVFECCLYLLFYSGIDDHVCAAGDIYSLRTHHRPVRIFIDDSRRPWNLCSCRSAGSGTHHVGSRLFDLPDCFHMAPDEMV